MSQVRAVSTHFLMVGAVQACTRSSRLAAFGATSTISRFSARRSAVRRPCRENLQKRCHWRPPACVTLSPPSRHSSADRKSTRLNSSHSQISYAVFCLKKKNYDRERVDHIRDKVAE